MNTVKTRPSAWRFAAAISVLTVIAPVETAFAEDRHSSDTLIATPHRQRPSVATGITSVTNFYENSGRRNSAYSSIVEYGNDDSGESPDGRRDRQYGHAMVERRQTQGSIVFYSADGGQAAEQPIERREIRYAHRRDAAEGGIAFRGVDEHDAGSTVIINGALPAEPAPHAGWSVGPKIIDVATSRLDRRPYGPKGIDVVMVPGGPKIIRLSPDYRAASLDTRPHRTRDGAVDRGSVPAARPPVAGTDEGESLPSEDGPVSRSTAATRASDLQPWSPGWASYCSRKYPSFEQAVGTYVAPNGKIRFCNAE